MHSSSHLPLHLLLHNLSQIYHHFQSIIFLQSQNSLNFTMNLFINFSIKKNQIEFTKSLFIRIMLSLFGVGEFSHDRFCQFRGIGSGLSIRLMPKVRNLQLRYHFWLLISNLPSFLHSHFGHSFRVHHTSRSGVSFQII